MGAAWAGALVTFAASTAQSVLDGFAEVLRGLDGLLDGVGGLPRPAPPGGPAPYPEPDHHLATPVVCSGLSAAHTRGGGCPSGVLPSRWSLDLVNLRGLDAAPGLRLPGTFLLHIDRPG